MHETADDLSQLNAPLDRCYARAGDHLRSIFYTYHTGGAP
jgi:hypothetical protein